MDFPVLYTFKNFIDLNYDEIVMVWNWRNDKSIRQWMYNQDKIKYENHLNFIDSLRSEKHKKYWMVFRNEKPIGVTSIVNIESTSGEWGYYIGPEFHDANLSVEFYFYSLRMVFEESGFKKLFGYAMAENKAANSLNDLFGFKKSIIDLNINNVSKKFYYRELNFETWEKDIKDNKRILRLLALTCNKN